MTTGGATIGDISTAALRSAVATAMVKMSSQGSVPAASAVLKLLNEIDERHASEDHRARLTACQDDTVVLARYLGECGVPPKDVPRLLGHPASKAEQAAIDDGAAARRLEVRALELASVRRGQKPASLDWMQR